MIRIYDLRNQFWLKTQHIYLNRFKKQTVLVSSQVKSGDWYKLTIINTLDGNADYQGKTKSATVRPAKR